MKIFSIISLILICHSIYSALRWRQFLQGNAEPIEYLPFDIVFEIILGAIMGCLGIAANGSRLKKINAFEREITYDKGLERKNFKTYNSARAQILGDLIKERLQLNVNI